MTPQRAFLFGQADFPEILRPGGRVECGIPGSSGNRGRHRWHVEDARKDLAENREAISDFLVLLSMGMGLKVDMRERTAL